MPPLAMENKQDNRLYAEFWFWFGGLFIAAVVALRYIVGIDANLIVPMAGGLIALLGIFFFGTKLMIPLYFATTFGTQVILPGLPFSLNRVMAGLLLLAFVMETPRRPIRLALGPALILFTAFQFYYLGMTVILRPPEAPVPFELIAYVMLFLIVIFRYWERSWFESLLWGLFIISTLVTVVPGILELLTRRDWSFSGPAGPFIRLNGFAANAIIYAFNALWIVPLGLVLFFRTKFPLTRAFLAASLIATILLALLTVNRQTPIVLAAMILAFGYYAPLKRKLLIGLVLAAISAIALVPVLPKLVERFQTTASIQMDTSLSLRHDKLLIARYMIADNPILGVGHNHFRYRWPEYSPNGEMLFLQFTANKYHYVDMGYIQILTEYGIVGSVLVLLLLFSSYLLFIKYYRMSRELDDPFWTFIMAALASLFAQLLVSLLILDAWVTPRTYLQFALLFAACVGIKVALEKQREQRQSSTLPV